MTSPMFVAPRESHLIAVPDLGVARAKSIASSTGTTSPLTVARRIVDNSLRAEATPGEMAWLQKNPILWLRALNRVKVETQSHIAKARAGREHLKPGPDEKPSDDFKAMLAEQSRMMVARRHFLEILDGHIEEVKSLCGFESPDERILSGDLVDTLVSIATLIETDNAQSARDKALHWAGRVRDMATGGVR